MTTGRRSSTPPPVSGTITRLSVAPRDAERTILHLDGRRAAALATEVVEAAGLVVGMVLSTEVFATLLREDRPYRARAQALRLLALRDRSSTEISSKLRAAGHDAAVISDTLQWLKGLGYLDDARFATDYVTQKMRAGWGERRIRQELFGKGVARALVDGALAGAAAESDGDSSGHEVLVTLVRKRFARQWQEDRAKAERRLVGFLSRRGYDWDQVAEVARLLDDELASAEVERGPAEE